MADHPILFSGGMVRAMLCEIEEPGTGKTQTRRVLTRLRRFGPILEFDRSDTPGYDWHFRDRAMRWHDLRHAELLAAMPYQVGDRLWVRETLSVVANWGVWYSADGLPNGKYIDDQDERGHALLERWGDHYNAQDECRIPSIFMPRWASRLTLTVTDVRVQRLQDISDGDAITEGIVVTTLGTCREGLDEPEAWATEPDAMPVYFASDGEEWTVFRDPRDAYLELWDQLNDERGFGSRKNPWVVAITFTPILGNIDQVAT